MALSSPLGFINDTQDNFKEAELKYKLLRDPIVTPEVVQSNIPWVYEKIELVDTFAYKTNDTIRFKFPRSGLIDPRSVRISFQVRALITSTVADSNLTGYFVSDINSIFRRCTLKCGSQQTIADIDPYNVYARTLSKMAHERQMTLTQRNTFNGCGGSESTPFSTTNTNNRNNYHSGGFTGRPQVLATPRRYMTQVLLGPFTQQKPLYLDPFHDDLVLEYTLDHPSFCAVLTSSGNPLDAPTRFVTMVEVGNPTLHYTRHIITDELHREMQIMIKSSQIKYQYHAHDYYRYPIIPGQKKHVFRIPVSRKWLKYAFAVIRCDKDRDAPQWDSFRTYASIDPTCNSTLALSIPLAYQFAKQSSIKEYQWQYAGQKIPNLPVRVSNTTTAMMNRQTNTPVVGASNTLTQRFDYSTLEYPFVTPGVEAWYMIEQLFLRQKELQLQTYDAAAETTLLPVDPVSPYERLVGSYEDGNITQTQGTTVLTGRVPCNFMMVGQFSEGMYDGSVQALSGGLENESLELHMECVDISSNSVPETSMFIDIFVAYDNILQLAENGILLTN